MNPTSQARRLRNLFDPRSTEALVAGSLGESDDVQRRIDEALSRIAATARRANDVSAGSR